MLQQAPTPPRILIERADAGKRSDLLLQGNWTIETAAEAETLASGARQDCSGTVTIHLSQVEALDTSGTWIVVQLMDQLRSDGRTVELRAGGRDRQALVDVLSTACSEIGIDNMRAAAKKRPSLFTFLEQIGVRTIDVLNDVFDVLGYLGASVWSICSAILKPDKLRWRSIISTLDHAGLRAAFIISLMAFLIGAIIYQQGAFYLRAYGGEVFAVDLVGTLVLREIGVLITAIMVAGRSGSAITAEIGSMKMQEEIDALKVSGLDPVDVLVVPRLISLIIALPLLTILANLSAMAGAAVVAASYSGTPLTIFMQRLSEAVDMQIAMIGLVKAPFMALVIGLIACMEGMKVQGSAASLGQQTTVSVVKSIFMVIVMDGVFAMVFAAIGI